MFFKSLMIYQATVPIQAVLIVLEEKLDGFPFKQCTPMQTNSTGFVPVGSDNGPLFLDCPDFAMVAIKHQKKTIPSSGLGEMVDDRVKEIEEAQGRKVYRKERLTIKDELVSKLLPTTVPTSEIIYVIFDKKTDMLMLNVSSDSKADVAVMLLRETAGSMPIMRPEVNNSPSFTMTNWLRGTEQELFKVGSSCEFKDPSDGGAVHQVKDEDLFSESATMLLDEGKMVGKLALTFDEQVSFVLIDQGCLKRLRFSNDLIKENDDFSEEDGTRFDADVALMIPTLRSLIENIGVAFGGWFEQVNMELTDGE